MDAEQSGQVVKRLEAIEARLEGLTETVNWMAGYLRERRDRQEQRLGQQGGPVVRGGEGD